MRRNLRIRRQKSFRLTASAASPPAIICRMMPALPGSRYARKSGIGRSKLTAPDEKAMSPRGDVDYPDILSVHRLTKAQARRIAVRAQLLDAPRPNELLLVVQQLTLLQIDPTAAVAP